MNEFIVWDKEKKKFSDDAWFNLHPNGDLVKLSNNRFYNCNQNHSIHNYIGKTDDTPEKNKIYADCSIVEFENMSEKQIGVFIYSNSISGYKIRMSKKDTWDEWLNINYNDMKNFKVIGTLQQDKHLLKESK